MSLLEAEVMPLVPLMVLLSSLNQVGRTGVGAAAQHFQRLGHRRFAVPVALKTEDASLSGCTPRLRKQHNGSGCHWPPGFGTRCTVVQSGFYPIPPEVFCGPFCIGFKLKSF